MVGNRPAAAAVPSNDYFIKRNYLTIIPTSSATCAPSETVNFCLYNTRSISNKGVYFVDFVSDNDLDIIVLTKTWLTSSDTVGCGNMTPKGYILYHQARSKDEKGGGVGLLCKSGFKVPRSKPLEYRTFDSISALITSGTKTLRVLVVYGPPSASVSGFLAEFASLLNSLSLDPAALLLVGDFNIRVNDRGMDGTARMLNLLASHGLSQHVQGPTHRAGNTLELLLTRSSETALSNVDLCDPWLSDHLAITSKLHLRKPPLVRI